VREPARSRRELSGATVLKRGTAFGLAGERPIHWELAEILAACAAAGPDATLLAEASPAAENLVTCVSTAPRMSALGVKQTRRLRCESLLMAQSGHPGI
jgi:hypothetical protein